MRTVRVGSILLVLLLSSAESVRSQLLGRPFLMSTTYLQGTGSDGVAAVTVDDAGNVYVAGTTNSADFMRTVGTLPARGSSDVFVIKFDPAGAVLLSAVFGGSSSDAARGIAVDAAGRITIVGDTFSSDFPVANPIHAAFHHGFCNEFGAICPDAFVTTLDPSGSSLLFSTYLGTTRGDGATGVAADDAGNIYVAGVTESAPFEGVTPLRGFSGTRDAFVAKFAPAPAGTLTYFTFLGGSSSDGAGGIAADGAGNVFLTGFTNSQNFPTLNPIQATQENFSDSAFVTKLDTSGAIAYSTYLGGHSTDSGSAIAVDTAGAAYVVGVTTSTNFPTVNAHQGFLRGGSDVFVARLHPSGSRLEYSTYLGGNDQERIFLDLGGSLDVAVDDDGNAFVTGATQSVDFPAVDPLQSFGGGMCTVFLFRTEPCPDAFLSKLNAAGRLIFSTPFGDSGDERGRGIAVAGGVAHVVGTALRASPDVFVSKFSVAPPACQLPAPKPLSPMGGIFDPRPTFSWEPVDGAATYAVIVLNLADHLLSGRPSVQFSELTQETSLRPFSTLPTGDYAWGVVALNGQCGVGEWSSGTAFTLPGICPAPLPVQISPAAGAVVHNPTRLEWSAEGPSVSTLFVVIILGGNGRLVGQYATAHPSFTVPQTLAAGDYAWFVASGNSTCGFNVSGPAFFKSSGMVVP
jgi:hypothetical protein